MGDAAVKSDDLPELLSVPQVAVELKVKLATAYQLVPLLTHVRIGRRVRMLRRDLEVARGDGSLDRAAREVATRDAERTNKRKYGLTLAARDAVLASQGGRCAICQCALGPFGNGASSACVDHCHDTGAVRGVLCGRCNKGLGQFLDKPEALERAAAYLRGAR